MERGPKVVVLDVDIGSIVQQQLGPSNVVVKATLREKGVCGGGVDFEISELYGSNVIDSVGLELSCHTN